MSAIEGPDALDHGVLRFLTAGSVDDGKSTLIGRLLYDTRAILDDQLASVHATSRRRGTALDLSLLTDGLVAEREQGITIDIAYRYFRTAHRKFIIADAPGHEQYTRNMVTAASTADAAVLLVDARRGVSTQTRRHATIAHLLRAPHAIVAVNKMDLVGWDRGVFDAIVAEFRAFAHRSAIAEPRFVPISATEGDMVVDRGEHLGWHRGATLLQILETLEVAPPSARGPLRFPVQYVARTASEGPHAGASRRYLGRVESGSIRVGDEVTVVPRGGIARVRAIHRYDDLLPAAGLHASIAVTLDRDLDVSRGDMLVDAASAASATNEIIADVCWLSGSPLDTRRTYVMRHATREVHGRVRELEYAWDVDTQRQVAAPAALAANDIARAAFTLAEPLCVDRYGDNRATGSFILIDEATNDTVAAGMIA